MHLPREPQERPEERNMAQEEKNTTTRFVRKSLNLCYFLALFLERDMT